MACARRAATILAIDDEPANVSLVGRILGKDGDVVVGAVDPREGLALFRERRPDLVVMDLHMPSMDGFELLRALGAERGEDEYLPILVLSGDLTQEARNRVLELGANDFVSKPFDRYELLCRARSLLQTRFLHLELERRNAELAARERQRCRDFEQAQVEMLERLAQAAEARDGDTGAHVQRVGEAAARIAARMGLAHEEVEHIRRAAPLHDVGKIGIPDALLLKRGGLTPEEREVMRTHTTVGARILSGGRTPLIETAAQIAAAHHERWDGGGYPRGLRGEAIPLAARIVAVADVFDALSHDRPYRAAWPADRVAAEILSERGGAFDPRVVDAFLSLLPELAPPAPSHAA